MSNDDAPVTSRKSTDRAAREAAALRENLRKRKQQARSRLAKVDEKVEALPSDTTGPREETV